MWKRYLAFVLAMVLVFHTVPMTVYAEEDAGFVQDRNADAESEEKSESEEKGDPKEKEEADAGQDDGAKAEQPGKEESGENVGEKRPGEDMEQGEGAKDEIDGDIPIYETDGSVQDGEDAASDEIISEEVEHSDYSVKKSGENIAGGTYKNEQDGSDISWVIDADGKLTVTGTGNFRPNENMTPDGDFSRLEVCPWSPYRYRIESAEIRVTGTTNASEMFVNCGNLKSVDLSAFDTSEIVDMWGMFKYCNSLTNLDLSSFNTGRVNDMSAMFLGCSSLESLDVSCFDTGNVTDMGLMFSGCSGLKELDLSAFNTGNVTDMSYMFEKCGNLETLDLSSFNTKNLFWMWGMFSECKSLKSLDMSNFNLSNMGQGDDHMFKDCESLTSIYAPYNIGQHIMLPLYAGYVWRESDGTIVEELPQHRSTSALITKNAVRPEDELAGGEYKENGSHITWRIDGNGKLTVEGEGEFAELAENNINRERAPWYSKRYYIQSAEINVTNMTDASFMFNDCNKMSVIDMSSFDTSQATNMQGMFRGCRSLQEIDLSGFDTRNVTNMSMMFAMPDSDGSIDNEKSYVGPADLNLSGFNTEKVTDMSNMFLGCGNLKRLDVSNFDTRNVANMNSMFEYCSSLAELDVSGFNTERVTDMSYMFGSCIVLKSLELSNFDTSNVTDMNGMFSCCNSLANLNVSSFNTSNVTNMGSMFFQNQLTSLDVSGFDTSKVTDMSAMFWSCRMLKSLDVSHFDTSEVTAMSGMFSDCKMLESLDISHFDTGKVVYMRQMFSNSSLVSVNLGDFNTGNVYNMSYMFSGCSRLKELDLSSFDVSKVVQIINILEGCSALNKIHTPKNLKQSVGLPKAEAGDAWQNDAGNTYTELPVNLNYSIILSRKGGSGSDDTDKQTLSVSGINIEDKVYDGDPNPYTGNVILTNASGKVVQNISVTHFYSGATADGNVYPETADAPSQAGNYTLTFAVTGANADQYVLNQPSYNFCITPREAFIVAETVSVEIGGQLPKVSELKYTVDGLVKNDELIKKPSFKYSVEDISTAKEGQYEIILYAADAGHNYSLKYVNGILSIGIPVPYITLEKQKTSYITGEKLTIDDLKVTYYNEMGIPSTVTDYTTNANEIDMSTPGTKTLVVRYRNLSAEIEITVKEKQTGDASGLKIAFKNEQDKESIYTGSAIKPEISVSYNGRRLIEGTNYTVKYANNVKVGSAKITVTGKGNFRSNKTENFHIVQADIADADIAGTDKTGELAVVSGSKFAPIVYCGSRKLTAKDYTIDGTVRAGKKITESDSNQIVTLKGKGNYTGNKRITLKVVKKSDLIKFTVTIDRTKLDSLFYDGKAHYIHEIRGAVTVTGKDGKADMKYGTDYMIAYPDNVTDVGVKKFSVIGMGLYTGTVNKSYTIKPAVNAEDALKIKYEAGNIENIKLPYRSTGVTFNDQLKVTYTRKGDTLTLQEGRDYKVTYSGNKKAGSNAKFIISFLGNYRGIKKQTGTFTIEKAELKDATVIIPDAVYNKKPGIYKSVPYVIEPETGRLIKASAYMVTYYTDQNRNVEMKGKNKVSSGDTVYVKIEAKENSNYRSDKPLIKTYQVTNAINLSKAKVSFMSSVTGDLTKSIEYTGQKITDCEIKVLIDGKPVDENMVVTYANNIDKGKATVIVTGTGKPGCKYTGCKKAAFNIVAYNLR